MDEYAAEELDKNKWEERKNIGLSNSKSLPLYSNGTQKVKLYGALLKANEGMFGREFHIQA